MPDSTKIKIESPGVNVAVVKNDLDGWKFLILKRSEEETYGGFWGFLTGGKKGDETVAQVVVREMKEEINLRPRSMWATEYLIQFYEPEYDAIWVLPLIVAVVDPEAKIVLSSENADYRWLEPRKAQHLVSWKNLVDSIDQIAEELEIYPAKNWVQIMA